jgi:hypothetical protein
MPITLKVVVVEAIKLVEEAMHSILICSSLLLGTTNWIMST